MMSRLSTARLPAAKAPRRLTEELLAAMDEEIALLERRFGNLQAISAAISARDADELERRLEQAEALNAPQEACDLRMTAVRQTLGEALGLGGQLRLGELQRHLDDDLSLAVEYRRQRIVLLAERLAQRHLQTTMLLNEFARINRLMLSALAPRSAPLGTYTPGGLSGCEGSVGLVDAEG